MEGYTDKAGKQAEIRLEKEKQEKVQYDLDINDMRWMLNDHRGRRIIKRILVQSETVATTEVMSAELHKREGKRLLGQWLINQILEAEGQQVLGNLIGELYASGK